LLPIAGAVIGAAFGAVALASIRRAPDRWGGQGMAQAGFAMGLAFGVVPLVALLAYATVVAHRHWAALPLGLATAYAVIVVAVAARHSRAVVAVSGLGIVGGAVALVAAVFLAYGAAVLFTHLIRDLVVYVFQGTKCAITHGGGSGKTCKKS
jgi:hypothetical protein